MTDSILFVGTSYLGAIKQGFEALYPESTAATFLGFNGPELAANLKSGWSVSNGCLRLANNFSCFVSNLDKKTDNNRNFPGTLKTQGLEIDLHEFDRVVFVDMFYHINPSFRLYKNLHPELNGIPVSDTLLAELKINGLNGWVSLVKHARFGNVAFENSRHLIAAIKNETGAESIFLLSAPRAPVGNVDLHFRYGDIASARQCFEYLERFYANELRRVGVEYLAQPLEVLDDNGCLTQAQYSRGAHAKRPNMLDGHMNQKYGQAILEKYSKKIIGYI